MRGDVVEKHLLLRNVRRVLMARFVSGANRGSPSSTPTHRIADNGKTIISSISEKTRSRFRFVLLIIVVLAVVHVPPALGSGFGWRAALVWNVSLLKEATTVTLRHSKRPEVQR